MTSCLTRCLLVAATSAPWPGVCVAATPRVELVSIAPRPFGVPRPFRDSVDAPVRTSLYLELAVKDSTADDRVDPNSVEVSLQTTDQQTRTLLIAGQQFTGGCRGTIEPHTVQRGLVKTEVLAVYIDPSQPLEANTRYTVSVSASARRGGKLPRDASAWSFTTEDAPAVLPVTFKLDLAQAPVRWHGAFFSGSDKTSFGSDWEVMGDTYDLMNEVRRRYPKAFSLQRDNHLTAGHLLDLTDWTHSRPNLVREQETRHITAVHNAGEGTELTVEDFFGHEQYGIASNRPLSGDYRAGDVVLIADSYQSAPAKVIRVSDRERTVLVTPPGPPPESWKLIYSVPLPEKAQPPWPGLFPNGGGYLAKLSPAGTPKYYWDRVDAEWDRAHRVYGRRFIVSLTDAPGELSIDGRARTKAKDNVELHEVMHTIADRIIKRYGKAAMEFYWFVFGEPDLGPLFWRTDWPSLQAHYDYTVDAILRAFEDNGFDSRQVKVGGLGLAASPGLRDLYLRKLRPFLIHCSPTAAANGDPQLLLPNAAFADARLDGKRSQRVETLCRANAGRGSPCDFISIHCYDGAKAAAGRLKAARQLALEIDDRYYENLWVLSDACCPSWHFPPDPANRDSYAGNGYFATWAVDMARRQLQAAKIDPRFAYGETAITVFPAPDKALEGAVPAFTSRIGEDEDGDGKPERQVTLKQPIFHMVEMLARMGDDFLVLPETQPGHHTVSGFASRSADELRILLYSHNEDDAQARSDRKFQVTLNLSNLPWAEAIVQQWQLDREHNSYFQLREKLGSRASYRSAEVAALREASELRETAPATRLKARNGVAELEVGVSGNGLSFLVLKPAKQ